MKSIFLFARTCETEKMQEFRAENITLKTESDVDIFVSKYILQNELSSLQNLQLI